MRMSKKEERLGTELINTDRVKLKCIEYINANNITVEAQILVNNKIHKEIIKNKRWDCFNHLNENGLSTMRVIRITVDNVDYKLCCKCHKWKIIDEFCDDVCYMLYRQ